MQLITYPNLPYQKEFYYARVVNTPLNYSTICPTFEMYRVYQSGGLNGGHLNRKKISNYRFLKICVSIMVLQLDNFDSKRNKRHC